MHLYLDNAATTRVCDEAAKACLTVMTECYGNPSSTHTCGREARKYLENSRTIIARTLSAAPECITFTSGGTESDNLAILGIAGKLKGKKKHIVTSQIEHDAVINPCKYLESKGFEVTYVAPDKTGHITAAAIKAALREDTALVSVMLVNNETGAVNPIADISKTVKAAGALMHTDAVQGYGKMDINVKSLGVDLLSISSHKIHGPKGCGALYIAPGTKISPILLGGGQENALRSGTEALPAIAGFAAAAEAEISKLAENIEIMKSAKDRMAERIRNYFPEAVIISPSDSVCILNIGLPGYRSEVMLNSLDARGIYLSKSSACKKGKRSHVLEAMGIDPRIIDGALRISTSRFTTIEEADYFAEQLIDIVSQLIKI